MSQGTRQAVAGATLVALVLSLFPAGFASANRNFDYLTLDGDTEVVVLTNGSITGEVRIDTTGSGESNDWESSFWRISTSPSSGGTSSCDNGPNTTTATNNVVDTFTMTAPSTAGTYSAYLTAWSDNGCANESDGPFTLTDAVIVVDAARTTQSATFNGDATTIVTTSGSVTIEVEGAITGGSNDWEGTSWLIATAPDTMACQNTSDNTSNGVHTESFSVTAPAAPGVYNAYLQINGSDSCAGGSAGTLLTIPNAVTVISDARTTDSATLDGGASVSVAPGASITAAVDGLIANGSDWDGTQWLISTSAPGTMTCENTPDHNDGSFTESFSITAPITPGTYNAYFRVSGNGSCSSQLGTLLTLTDAITVVSPDSTPPSGGSITYADGYNNTASVGITYTLGTDSGTGINASSGKIQRASATLTGSTCGVFGSFSDLVTESDGSYTDTTVTTGMCYIYQYVIEDNSSNSATYNSANVVKVDTVAPTVTISSPSTSNPTNVAVIPLVITFSEDVTGFDETDLVVVGGSAGAASGGPSVYNVDITPSGDPVTFTVNMASGGAFDLANNPNTAATQFSRTYNSTALSVTINSGPAHNSIQSTDSASFTFTTDGTSAQCSIDGGSSYNACTSFTAPSGTHDLTGLAHGSYTFVVQVSASGMDDVESAPRAFEVDLTNPTVTTLGGVGIIGGWASTSPLLIDIIFSDDIIDFILGDLLVTNGNAGTLLGSGSTYNFEFTPTADGPVTIDLPGGVVTEANGSGRTNDPATQLAFTFDGTAPLLSIDSGPLDGSATSSSSIEFAFSASDANGGATECSLDGAATSSCSSPQSFPGLSDGSHVFMVEANDPAGNTTFLSHTFTVDTLSPVLIEVTPVPTPSTDTTPEYTFNTTEDGDVVVAGSCSFVGSANTGDNTIGLGTLPVGTYTDCSVTLTDTVGNISNTLDIPAFTIEEPVPASTGGGGGGGGGLVVGSGSIAPGVQNTNPTNGEVAGASTENTGTPGTPTTPTTPSTNTGGTTPSGSAGTGSGNTQGASNGGTETQSTGGTVGEEGASTETPEVTAPGTDLAAAVGSTNFSTPLALWLSLFFAALFSFFYWLWSRYAR